ncbi:MAG: hypothetical protein LUH02_01630 [Erysipelotrichaceae bacterium]|nr:hypothetical protein [Erysipelotrichaceae bacterium]
MAKKVKKQQPKKEKWYKKIKLDDVLSILEIVLKVATAIVIGVFANQLLNTEFLSYIHFGTINDMHSSYLFSTMNKGKDLLVLGAFVVTVLYMLIYLIQIKLNRRQLIDKIYLIFFFASLVVFFAYVFGSATATTAQISITIGAVMFVQRFYFILFYIPIIYTFVIDFRNTFMKKKGE